MPPIKRGLTHDQYHRYYYNGAGPLPSVTTIAGVLDKSGPLVGWAKRITAEVAVRDIAKVAELIANEGPEVAQAYISSQPDRERDRKADLGTRVHELANKLLTEQVIPTEDALPYVKQYIHWLTEKRPTILYSEAAVANLTLGYGGTFDIGCTLDGVLTLLDIKTGSGVYDEVALQLAGYAGAEFTASADDPTPRPLPQWQRFGVLHLTDGAENEWEVIPFVVNADTHEAFRAAHRLQRWRKESVGATKGEAIKSISWKGAGA